MLRDTIKTATITAMKAGDKPRTAALRLIQAKIKDRDIELRTGTAPADDDALVTEVLQKMIKQRRESVTMYRQGNREELAAINAAASSSAGEEAVDALVMLGYTKTEAASAVGRLDQSLSSEELIKQALRLISKNI